MTDQDKPKVHFSAAALEKEAGDKVDPFVYMTAANKRVTFPDPYDMEADEGEERLRLWQSGNVSLGQILSEWLAEADRKALDAEKFTVRQRALLVNKAINYYEQAAGTLGEGGDSES